MRILFSVGFFYILTSVQYLTAQGNCTSAIPLTPSMQQCGNTADGGDLIDDNLCLGSYDGGDDFLFSYTVPLDQDAYIMDLSLLATGPKTGIAVTEGCPEAEGGTCIVSATSENSNEVLITPPLIAGLTYYIHISTLPSPQSVFFCLDAILGPQGCTNVLANNYDATAIVEDGSCLFPDPMSTCGIYSSFTGDSISNGLLPIVDDIEILLGANKVITDLDLIIDLEHTAIGNLDISLTSPSGTTISLMTNHCGANQNLTVRFDDDAYPLDCDSPTTGFYAPPDDLLASFNNETIDGTWTLTIVDNTIGNDGNLIGWCLAPTTLSVTCFSPSNLNASNITYTNADLSWDVNNSPLPVIWEIELLEQGNTPAGFATHTSSNNEYAISNLSPQTTYEFYVRSFCNPDVSFWTGPFVFTTILSNPTPCGFNFPIADASCTESNEFVINVENANGTQLGEDVILEEVRLIIAHPWNDDLDIQLASPSGIVVNLSTDNGGSLDNYGDPNDASCSNPAVFTMNTCRPILNFNGEILGSFLPQNSLYNFSDGSNPNGLWTLRICDDASGDVGTLEYIELVFSDQTCPIPSNVNASNVYAESVELTWDLNSDCETTIIEYGPSGFIPGTGLTSEEGVAINFSCSLSLPYTLDGLMELSDYDIYIRKDCGDGQFSPNSCVISITTDCATGLLTLGENFDTLNTCGTSCGNVCPLVGTWSNAVGDDFDWLVDNEGTASSGTGPSDDVSIGGNYIYVESTGDDCQDGNQGVLISNCIQVEASSGTCHMSFYYHLFGSSIGSLNFEITTNSGISWQSLWSLSGSQGNAWMKQYIDLSAFDGQAAQFRFVCSTGDSFRGDMALDNIEFYGSQVLNESATTFYLDADQDGFGTPDVSIMTCALIPPLGYVNNALDCDDTNFLINPDVSEIPCNLLDDDCNVNTLDNNLQDPQVADYEICSDEILIIEPTNIANGTYYWYDEPDGNLLSIGPTFTPGDLLSDATFYVKDSSEQCVSALISFFVSVNVQPNISTGDQPIICEGESFDLNNLNIIDINEANGNLTFHTDFPANVDNLLLNPIVNPTTTTSYFILSENGTCTDETNVIIQVNSKPNLVILPGGDLEICANESVIFNAVELGTGQAPFTYLWNNNATANVIQALPNSNPEATDLYTVVVTDANGCTNQSNKLVTTLASITAAAIDNVTDVSICGGNNGYITISPVNGQSPFNYQWTGPVIGNGNSDGSFTMENLSQGSYRLSITDSSPNACQLVIPVMIINGPSAVVDTMIVVSEVTCYNFSNGSIDITVTGDNPSYLWSNGATSQDLEDIPAGNYSVTISDGVCQNILSDIEVAQPLELEINVNSITMASCNGSDDGAIDIEVTGGTLPFEFTWDPIPTNTEDVSGLSAGIYEVDIVDGNGCLASSFPIGVGEPDLLEVELNSIVNVSCFGEDDGRIFITTSGGKTPYSYLWSNGMTGEDPFFLIAGTYTVTITDANECTLVSSVFMVDEPSQLGVTLNNIIDASCHEVNDGIIFLSTFGGTPPYTYTWSNLSAAENIFSLVQGTYTLTVTDANECTFVSPTYTVSAPEEIGIENIQITNATCLGVDDGSIQMGINGGVEPYNFIWSNGETSRDIFDLAPDNYFVTITDGNGCLYFSDVFTIEAPQVLNYTVDQLSSISCYGRTDGNIYITVSGGNAPYHYNWSNGSVLQNLVDLSSGTYTTTILDDMGCVMESEMMMIEEPDSLDLEIISVENTTCANYEDGSIDISISGGTAPYIYSWSNGDDQEDLAGVPTGSYKVTLIDDRFCVLTSEVIQVGEPSEIEINVLEVIDADCGGDGGSIDIEVNGGMPEYTFLWSTGDTTQNISTLEEGNYSVTIMDELSCLQSFNSIQVNLLANTLPIEINEILPINCFGENTGSISVNIEGGTAPFQYNWSNGITNPINDNLASGYYDLTLTDLFGCVGILPVVFLPTPPQLEYDLDEIIPNPCYGDSIGAINISTFGGTAPYTFLWNTGQEEEDIIDLAVGTYRLTVTDAFDCEIISNDILVDQPSEIEVVVDSVYDVSCFGFNDGQIFLSVDGGNPPYQFISNDEIVDDNFINLDGGIFNILISDQEECDQSTVVVEIEESDMPLSLPSNNVFIENNTACEDNIGSISLEVIGGTAPYSFHWSDDDLGNEEEVFNLSNGNYLCTITDANGCLIISEVINISQIDALTVESFSSPELGVNADGTASVIATGGNLPYSYLWDFNANSQTDSLAINLTSGVYAVTITDEDNCTTVENVEVSNIVSTDEFENKVLENFIISPNPSKGSTQISVNLTQTSTMHIEIFSLLGQKILDLSKENITSFQKEINLENLPTSVYLVRLTVNGNLTLSKKLVLLKE